MAVQHSFATAPRVCGPGRRIVHAERVARRARMGEDHAAVYIAPEIAGDDTVRSAVSEIIEAAASHFDYSRAELIEPSRAKARIYARHVAIYLTLMLSEHPPLRIAHAFGGRPPRLIVKARDEIADILANRFDPSERYGISGDRVRRDVVQIVFALQGGRRAE